LPRSLNTQHMPPLQRSLWKDFGKQILVSLGIFSTLFLILYIVEWLVPSLQGTLLQWHDPAFVVGIPASAIGVGYVLTIRNPKNYTGFYGGILLNLLLSLQFALQGNWDLMIMHSAMFVPFQVASLLRWRRQVVHPAEAQTDDSFRPAWLSGKWLMITLLFTVVVTCLDYVLLTEVIYRNAWTEDIAIKVFSGLMVASSILSNFLMIIKKIDAWVWWVVYSLAGMIFYVLIGNIFSLVLFFVFLLVNGSVGIVWLKLSKQ